MVTSNQISRRNLLAMGAAGCAACAVRAEDEGPPIDVGHFRKPGRTDADVIGAALQAWQRAGTGTLRFERGRQYDLGRVDDGPDFFAVSGLVRAKMQGNGARVLASSAQGVVWNCFSFSNIDGLEISDLSFRDTGYRGETAAGMKALVFQPGLQGTKRIGLSNVRADNVLAMVQTQGPVNSAPRVEGIVFHAGCVATRSYYALCCQEQGDDVSGTIRCIDCRRSYLVFGVDRHDLNLVVENTVRPGVAPSRSSLLIKSYGRATTRLNLRVAFFGELSFQGRSSADRGSCMMLELQGDSAARPRIANVELALDLTSAHRGQRDPAVLTLSSLRRDGQPIAPLAGSFADIAVAVRSDRLETIAVPRAEIGRGSVTLSGDVDAHTLRYSD